MRRAIVHIGLPRTGTTSLQHLLAGARDDLSAAGILYPDLTPASAAGRHLSHQHLGEAFDGRRPDGERTELLDLLARQLGRHEVVLLSYEGLCLLPWWRFAPARLARLFAQSGYAMEVVATVKPQAELLNSTYTWRAQFLREKRPFAAFFRAELGRWRLDTGAMLAEWSAAAEGRLTVVPVRDRRSPRPLAARFLTDLRLPFAWPEDRLAVRENGSPGPVAIAVDLALRTAGWHRVADPRALTRAAERLAVEAGYDAERFNGIGSNERAEVAARWHAANDRLARRVWSAPWNEVVAAEAPAPVNERIAADPATKAAVDEIMRAVAANAR